MPHIPQLRPVALHNRYYGLRHGESIANQQGIIVSDPKVGCREYGLSEIGKAKLRGEMDRFRQELGQPLVYASDFLRTRETAEIVTRGLKCSFEPTPLLRERWFGDFDGSSNANYETVWNEDRNHHQHTRWNVETVLSVAERVMELIRDLEDRFTGATILLVSHGDPLQTLECVLRDMPIGCHRDVEPLLPGDLRRLRLLNDNELARPE
jgi:probable phosphoglycerate mutase